MVLGIDLRQSRVLVLVLSIDLQRSRVLVLVLGIDLGPLEVLVLVLTFAKLVLPTSDIQASLELDKHSILVQLL